MSIETLVRSKEEQVTEKSHQTELVNDIYKLDRIRKLSEEQGVKSQAEKLSYDPFKARAKYERLREANPSQEQVASFKRHESREVDTALRERHNAAQSVTIYTLGEDGEIYNELFHEPFTIVLQRGIVHQKMHDPKELRREEDEFDGWLEVCNKLLKDPNAKLHTKAIIISGPGIIENTNYKGNVVDVYELLEDPVTRKRYLKMVRHASEMTYGQYYDKALLLEPNYFNDVEGPIDAWLLKHPLFLDPDSDRRSVNEIFEQIFERQKGAIDENLMLKILDGSSQVKDFYIDVLCQDIFNPREIARAWNATLVISDSTKVKLTTGSYHYFIPTFTSIYRKVAWLSMQEIERRDTACPGTSAGFIIGGLFGNSPYLNFLTNSVGKHGLTAEQAKNDPNLCRCSDATGAHFHCPGTKEGKPCKHPIVVGEGTTTCPKCGAGKVC